MRHLDVSRQKLTPHCLATIFDSQLPSPKLSPKMPPKLSLAHKRGHFFLFQNYPRGEGNCETIERQKLSRSYFCPATSRCLFGPLGKSVVELFLHRENIRGILWATRLQNEIAPGKKKVDTKNGLKNVKKSKTIRNRGRTILKPLPRRLNISHQHFSKRFFTAQNLYKNSLFSPRGTVATLRN